MLCHSVFSCFSPALSFHVSVVAMRILVTASPPVVYRVSGSLPRLPTRITLFTDAIAVPQPDVDESFDDIPARLWSVLDARMRRATGLANPAEPALETARGKEYISRLPAPPLPPCIVLRHRSCMRPVTQEEHGIHPHSRRQNAQPQEHQSRSATTSADRHHRALRLGQEFARFRHALRRRSAALRRVALGVCAAIPAADGKTRRRSDRRPVA